jgi:hypothetical protein
MHWCGSGIGRRQRAKSVAQCTLVWPRTMDYLNGRRLNIHAHAELRDLKDETDPAQRLASPGYKAKVERAVLLPA